MRKIQNQMILIILFVTPLILSAQVRLLTLDECIKTGLNNSKILKVSKSKTQAAESRLDEVNAGRLPSLKFSGSYSRLSEVDPFYVEINGRKMSISPVLLNSTQFRLTLAQPIFTGFRLDANSEMTGYLQKATEEDYKKDVAQLILDIKNNYWSLYNALEAQKSITESIQQLKAHFTDLENMFNSGLATKNDVLKTRVQLSNLELTKMDIENGLQMAMMALNNTIGIPVTTEITVKPEINYQESTFPEKDDLIKKALNERNEIKAMELRIKAGDAGVTMSQSGWYPQLSFSANYLLANPNQRIMPSKNEFMGTWDLNLNLSMDLWNWMTVSHQTAQAKATLEQSKYGLEQIRDGITLELSQSYMSLKKFREKIVFAGETIKQAEENFRVTNEKFKSGIAINSDLLDAETALLVSKINYSTSIAEYEIAMAKLEKSYGKNVEQIK